MVTHQLSDRIAAPHLQMHSGGVILGGNTTRPLAVPTPAAGTDQEKEEAGGCRDPGALLEEAPATHPPPTPTLGSRVFFPFKVVACH